MIGLIWIIASASLLLMPPVALVMILIVQNSFPTSQRTWAIASAGMILCTIFAVFFRVSFVWGVANVLWLLACYLAYCLLVASCLQIQKRLLRWPVLLVSAVPIALGYVIATIGSLGLGFILSDALAGPSYTQNEADGLTCSVTGWGFAGGDSGSNGSLFRSWFGVPFLQKEVAWISVDESNGSVSRSDSTDLPSPIHDKDFCSQLMSVRINRN
jgi:hypothetical protein